MFAEPQEGRNRTVFGLSGREFLAGLRAAMLRRGNGPRARILGMWDALENMLRSANFNESFVVRAAIAVRAEPGRPVPSRFVEHYAAVREMLTELVCDDAKPNDAERSEPDPDPDPGPDPDPVAGPPTAIAPSPNGSPSQSPNAWRLASQLEMLVQGAIAGSAIDQEPAAVLAARELSMIALTINGYQA
jgi:hypothetical protein